MKPLYRHCSLGLLAALLAGTLLGCPEGGPVPVLSVEPNAVYFGETGEQDTVVIRNTGSGTLTWTVDEAVPWLTVDRVTGQATSPGTSRIYLTASREGLDASGVPYQDTFTIRSGDQTETVSVSMLVGGGGSGGDPGDDPGDDPGAPAITVTPSDVSITSGNNTADITIANAGEQSATWRIQTYTRDDPPTVLPLPDEISIAPLAGTVEAGAEDTTTLLVDLDALQAALEAQGASALTYPFSIRVTAAGAQYNIPVTVTFGGIAEIGVDTVSDDGELGPTVPPVLTFGEDLSIMTMDIFNMGPAGTTLIPVLTVQDEEGAAVQASDVIEVSDVSGDSKGTSTTPPNYDPLQYTVTIDRSAFPDSFTGTILVQAQGETEGSINSAVEPVEVLVTAKNPPLRFEGAMNRTRPPFIMRYVFLLRDRQGAAIPTTNADGALLPKFEYDYANGTGPFTVYEDDRPLDLAESNVFVTPASALRYDMVLMLDYTGSMYQTLTTAYPATDSPLHKLYAGGLSTPGAEGGIVNAFLDNIPQSYHVSLMEYHARQQQDRVVSVFARGDRSAAKEDLADLRIPAADHGASEIYDALIDACTRLAARDAGALPLNDADVRALAFITDGRDTSSVETLSAVNDAAEEFRVRLYPIGFGDNVAEADLIELATESGGHYYRAPTLEDLVEIVTTTLPNDLSSQVALTYNTLFQEGSHTYRIEGDIDGLTGQFERDAVFAVGGDVRAGQLSLHCDGARDNGDGTYSATVFLRADYTPRGISQFKFRIWRDREAQPLTMTAGALLDGWIDLSDSVALFADDTATWDAQTGGLPSVLRYWVTSETTPLRFGSFGEVAVIELDNVNPAGEFLHLRVDNRVYSNPPYTKFFQYPLELPIYAGTATRAAEQPLLVSEGFDPDAEGAWDEDEDGVNDFNDSTIVR